MLYGMSTLVSIVPCPLSPYVFTIFVSSFIYFFFLFSIVDSEVKRVSSHEFVSDTLQATSQDIVEVQENMKKLTIKPGNNGKVSVFLFFFCCLILFGLFFLIYIYVRFCVRFRFSVSLYPDSISLIFT